MRLIYFHILLLLCPMLALAQAHDKNWIMIFPPDDAFPKQAPYPTSLLNFETSPPIITYMDGLTLGQGIETLISDAEGTLLFIANGRSFSFIDGQFLMNGSPSFYTQSICGQPDASMLPFSLFILPKPKSDKDFLSFQIHEPPECLYWPIISYSTITMSLQDQSGVVLPREKIIFEGYGIDMFDATKHANGEDWWISFADLYPQTGKRYFHSFLVKSDTIYDALTQEISGYDPVINLATVATWERVFSPDGKYMASLDILHGIRIHSFDRCTGLLGPLFTLPYPSDPASPKIGGAAFSPNSRYLYISSADYLYQYDMQASNIDGSKELIVEYDGFISPEHGERTVLVTMKLAPDGKIYFFNNGSQYIHYIAKPNLKGKNCLMMQRGIKLPTRAHWPPQYPNYRLGPIDNSPCDTLGLDNKPQADFWWFADSTLTVEFADNSTYEPTHWHWDFGEGTTSQDTSPVHTFPAAGIYEVCLIVSNQYAADTICKEVAVGFTSDGEPTAPVVFRPIEVFPNPADGFFQLVYELENPGANFELFDASVRRVRERTLGQRAGNVIFNIENLPPGIYFWKITDACGQLVRSSKLAILH